jgi:hypothetical protein
MEGIMPQQGNQIMVLLHQVISVLLFVCFVQAVLGRCLALPLGNAVRFPAGDIADGKCQFKQSLNPWSQ